MALILELLFYITFFFLLFRKIDEALIFGKLTMCRTEMENAHDTKKEYQ